MTEKVSQFAVMTAAVMFFVVAFYLVIGQHQAFASAPSGLPATETLATTTSVGPGNQTKVFSNRPTCASRVIRTQEKDIYILFADPLNGDLASTTLTGIASFTQAASTTTAYDSGIYGCGAVYIKSPISSTTLTVMETQ